jgi:hypothetical protein
MIRPAWTPATIALMVLGFVIFWPLGLAMLAYILWGDRLEGFKKDVDRATDSVSEKFRNGSCGSRSARTGNTAFDEWREQELERIAEERKKLDEEIREFDEYKREMRRTQDSEEFEAFKKARKRKPAPRSGKSSAEK